MSPNVQSLIAAVRSADIAAAAVLTDALLDAGGSMKVEGGVLVQIQRKGWTRFGTEHPAEVRQGRYALVSKGRVELFGIIPAGRRYEQVNGRMVPTTEAKAYSRSFAIGDEAEHHSYNLSYTGLITSVTTKGVTIDKGHNDGKARLDLESFDSRNWDFDAVESADRNTQWFMTG
jgi:hypothetical protein